MSSSNILAGLNPQQLEAVTLAPQSALILAGAGSGKTRVLTTRIAWLIQTGQVSPHGILAVTFTNKAAREMLTRISAMLPINTRGMWVGTFHGLCNRLLRAHYRDARLPQTFQILDSQDQLALIKRLLKSLNVDDEKYPPRDLQYFINSNKEAGRRASAVETQDNYYKRLIELYAEYDQQCNREGVVDFAELLLRCFELLSRHEILRAHYQQRFSHVLVDEFQDTNRLQYQWLKLLAGGHNAIFAVGDDDQSIYAFRGASARNMFDFEREFAQGRVIKLEQNYRSQGNILSAANALISHNRHRLGKELWTLQGQWRGTARVRGTDRYRRGCIHSRRNRKPARERRSGYRKLRCCTDRTLSHACWSTRCSTPACPIACMAACGSSSARKSSMPWRISGWCRIPRTTALFCGW